MYSQYLQELTDKQVIETTHGFVTYSYPTPDSVYIENIFTKPEFRNTDTASNLADAVASIAKRKGCTKMIGTVNPSSRGSTASLKVLLAYGMVLVSSTNDLIVFSKGIA